MINFINVFRARFLYKSTFLLQNFVQKCFAQLFNFWLQNIGEKSAQKMLMKLTPTRSFCVNKFTLISLPDGIELRRKSWALIIIVLIGKVVDDTDFAKFHNTSTFAL